MKKEKVSGNMDIAKAIGRVCGNCMDFDGDRNVCTVRNVIHKDKSRTPMPRKAGQRGCDVFMAK